MKTLIVLSAIPASGKSTWAAEYQGTHGNVFIVSSDGIRMELTNGNFQDHTKQKEVWSEFSARIHKFGQIDGATVILDALNDLNSLRRKYVEENPEFDKYILVLMHFSPERSRYYNSLRPTQMQVPSEALESLIEKYEQPDEETKALFDEIWYVNWRNKNK